jgi:hypothetical protein
MKRSSGLRKWKQRFKKVKTEKCSLKDGRWWGDLPPTAWTRGGEIEKEKPP